MALSIRILAAAAALGLALAAGSAAAAAPGVVPPDGEGCSLMMAQWQSAQAQHSATNPADLDAYNVVQNAIDRAAHFCEAGQDAEAKQIMEASKRSLPAPR